MSVEVLAATDNKAMETKTVERTRIYEVVDKAIRIVTPFVVGLPFIFTSLGSGIQSFLQERMSSSTLANFTTVGMVAIIARLASFAVEGPMLGKKTPQK